MEWRDWLSKQHLTAKNIWLIIHRKNSGKISITYEEAVEQALCFGWIDSIPNKRDDESYYQFFAKRNPKSNWIKKIKDTIERLLIHNKVAPAGKTMIEEAKQSGTWTALDDVENLVVPEDLAEALKSYKDATEHFQNFPKSVKRGILEWILNAKRPETRQKRINETAEKAAQNIRVNQYR